VEHTAKRAGTGSLRGVRSMPRVLAMVGAALISSGLATVAMAQDASPTPEQLERGEVLFDLCAQCHGANGEGQQLALAPSIAGIDAWYVEAQINKFRSGSRSSHFDDRAGLRMRPMARWLKTEDDVKAVSAYVASLAPARSAPTLSEGLSADELKASQDRGQVAYAICTQCHGADGKGQRAVPGYTFGGAPPLILQSDWYLATQLKNFQQEIRGNDKNDEAAKQMLTWAKFVQGDDKLKDVLAYITKLGNTEKQAQVAGGAQ